MIETVPAVSVSVQKKRKYNLISRNIIFRDSSIFIALLKYLFKIL